MTVTYDDVYRAQCAISLADQVLSKADFEHARVVSLSLTTLRQRDLGVLHDVLEETNSDQKVIDLILSVFDQEFVDDLLLLTHSEGRYRKYIQKLAESGRADAIAVKLADLEHNMDLSRLEKVEQYHLDRNNKYKKAHRILTEALTLVQS